jgi:thiol:disulfide interchange protein DsbA
MEPYLVNWLKNVPADVEFIRVPATFNRPNVRMHAKTYYALEQLGLVDKYHAMIFDAIHTEKQKLDTQPEMEAFLAAEGMDVNAFRAAMESFEINLKLQQAIKLAKKYEVTGVPVMVVDQHYRGGNDRTWNDKLKTVDYLIAKARQTRPAPAEAAAVTEAPVTPATPPEKTPN